jgi:hypothetical protein
MVGLISFGTCLTGAAMLVKGTCFTGSRCMAGSERLVADQPSIDQIRRQDGADPSDSDLSS